MKSLVVFLSTVCLAGCATAPPSGPSYHAVGTEPFWSLVIDDHALTFTVPGMEPVRQPRPKAIFGFAGEIYQTPRIRVNIVHAQCSDGMSDRTYKDSVQVDVDYRRFKGCGGL